MKGIILAEALGIRLYPSTKPTNKHLLPLYDRPMVFISSARLAWGGIKEIIIIPGDNAGDYWKNGSGAKIFLIKVPHQSGFGVSEFNVDRFQSKVEKPKLLAFDFAAAELNLYDSSV
jgi:dTDP-glucose pyrophosphorylase